MRHLKKNCKFSRNSSHRKSMFRNMVISLVYHEIIKTTLPKAKELRRIVEPIINLSKIDNLSNRRFVFSKVRRKETVSKLFNILGIHFKDRSGGYTRIIKFGNKSGNESMAYIEIVNRNDILKKN